MGVHCNVPALLAFNQSNTLGAANRAMSSGLLIACGAIGGIIGSLIFRAQVSPYRLYVDGDGAVLTAA